MCIQTCSEVNLKRRIGYFLYLVEMDVSCVWDKWMTTAVYLVYVL